MNTCRQQGERIRLSKWIRGDTFVVGVTVEGVLPIDDPSQPCLEPDTTRFLDHLQDLADARNFAELEKHGTIYMRRSA